MSKERKKLIKELDNVFSLFIRARDGKSVFSGKSDNLQCFHIFSRVSNSTRWNERNCFASTSGENLLYEHDAKWQHDVHTWFINKFGQNKFDELHALWHQTTKFTENDLKLMIQLYKDKLKALKEGA
jgi:hypothetical protein